ncbi:hypothetical protein EDD86DRAFT_189095 [Gorgonomyces haynaldii]|nr:hypothetical protein EDD86DRAFT_189095 [Gorgonomyces haynaldii]
MEASPIFDTLIDTEQPMNILRIESLNPVPVDPFDFGKFCVADCYIILVKLEEFQLYTWIGSDAEIDKKFCCAMFAVGLRNFLEAKCKIQRETEGDESLEFLSLFPVFEYQDSSNAAESGLYVTQEKQYPTRLYKIKGKNEMQLELCNPHPSSLLEENVYLLDCGLELYQWNGGKSTLSHRSKCRIICARIIKGDRAGKAVFVEMDQGQESEQFLEHLDGLPLDERVFDYEVGLYKIDAQKTLEEQRISEKLSRELLDKGNCYIVDAGTELFFWMGKDSLPRDRLDATLVLAKLIESKERPSWVALHRCAQDNEPEVFKLRFSDWEKKSQQSLPSIRT